jgi:NADH:ubiquinone oxidoreductase subunit B-like Fe-S oxidoreductase
MRTIYNTIPSDGFLGAVFTRLDQALNWCRLSSVWYLLFGLAC